MVGVVATVGHVRSRVPGKTGLDLMVQKLLVPGAYYPEQENSNPSNKN